MNYRLQLFLRGATIWFIKRRADFVAYTKLFCALATLLLLAISKPASSSIQYSTQHQIPKITNLYPVTFEKKEIVFEIAKSRHNEVLESQKESTKRVASLSRMQKKRAEVEMQAKNLALTELRALYKELASQFNIDWRLLEAVHEVESGKSGDTAKTSYAGAVGPMQFLPSTFRKYALDYDGDGVPRVTSLKDSLYAATKLLAENGANVGKEEQALFAYNHTKWYVWKVLKVKSSISE